MRKKLSMARLGTMGHDFTQKFAWYCGLAGFLGISVIDLVKSRSQIITGPGAILYCCMWNLVCMGEKKETSDLIGQKKNPVFFVRFGWLRASECMTRTGVTLWL